MKRFFTTMLVMAAMTGQLMAQKPAATPDKPLHGTITASANEQAVHGYLVKMDSDRLPGNDDHLHVERTNPDTHQVFDLGEARVFRINRHTNQVWIIAAGVNEEVGRPDVGDDVTVVPKP